MRAFVLTLAVAALAGCALSPDLRLGPEANGREVEMSTGDELVIALPEGDVPRQTWRQLQGNDYRLPLTDSESEAGTLTLTFEAEALGPVTLLYALQRQTAAGPETERIFTLDVLIR